MTASQIVCVCLVGVVAGQQARTLPETATHVPILRYIDQQNADGSYTYGFEGGDGTYKIETRLASGQVKGKYGYYDPEGQLREATYGATSKGGFQPQIQGVILPPAYTDEDNELDTSLSYEVQESPQQFSNFADRNIQEVIQPEDVKVVNGRRAVLKRRPVTRPGTETYREEISPEERLRERQLRLKQLREQRRQLKQLQQQHIQRNQPQQQQIRRNQPQQKQIRRNQPQQQQIRRNQPQQQQIRRNQLQSSPAGQEAFRSFLPQPQTPQYQQAGPVDQYITHGAELGSYTIRY